MNRPLSELAEIIVLQKGAHKTPQDGVCVEELCCWIAGEAHSDNPECASPVIARFLMALNDRMPDSERQRLAPYALRQIGTRGSEEQECQRGFLCADWAVRVVAPMALRASGHEAEAERLEALAPVVDVATARAAAVTTGVVAYASSSVVEAASRAAAYATDAATAAVFAEVASSVYAASRAAYATDAATAAWSSALQLVDRLIAVTGSSITAEVEQRAHLLRERIAVEA